MVTVTNTKSRYAFLVAAVTKSVCVNSKEEEAFMLLLVSIALKLFVAFLIFDIC